MALDSADKRFSMLGLGLDALRVRPAPDGTIDADDRRHFLPLYRGIAAAASAVHRRIAPLIRSKVRRGPKY